MLCAVDDKDTLKKIILKVLHSFLQIDELSPIFTSKKLYLSKMLFFKIFLTHVAVTKLKISYLLYMK